MPPGGWSSDKQLGQRWSFLVIQVFYEPDEFVEGLDAETRGEVLQDRSVRSNLVRRPCLILSFPCPVSSCACSVALASVVA